MFQNEKMRVLLLLSVMTTAAIASDTYVKVEQFGMVQCPMTSTWLNHFWKFCVKDGHGIAEIVNFTEYFVGGKNGGPVNDDTWNTSFHGPQEIVGDKFHLCAKAQAGESAGWNLAENRTWLDYEACMNGDIGIAGAWELKRAKTCAEKFELDYERLNSCANGVEGTALYKASVFYTSSQSIKYDTKHGIPVVRINGTVYQGLSAYEKIGSKICDAYDGDDKPANCGCGVTLDDNVNDDAWTEATGGPYGLAKTPPLGWRSWNAYHSSVSQDIMEAVMEKMVEKHNGTSLLDLGYKVVGLDDNWQACGTGFQGSFHDESGRPLVNETLFPNMKAMVDKAHDLGLLAGFYMNNCICNEHGIDNATWIDSVYKSSVDALVNQWNFDGVKLDGCSQFHNTTYWSELMAATGEPVLVENCHNTHAPTAVPDPSWLNGECPYNWFRSSTDINPSWGSIMNNLASVVQYQPKENPLSGPGCWTYPDMLEVGNMNTFEESRAHFGAWAVVSAPLILGYDLKNDEITDSIWPIISNEEAIAVNQQYAGHPGYLVRTDPPDQDVKTSALSLWAKPQPGGGVAAFIMSNQDVGAAASNMTIDIHKDLGMTSEEATVRCIWMHKDMGETRNGRLQLSDIAGHDSRFFLFEPL